MGEEIFVGRREEQEKFAALVRELPVGRGWRPSQLLNRRPRGNGQAEADRSHVVLVSGLGGTGKSRLLRRFQEIAEAKIAISSLAQGAIRTVRLDWADEQRDDPSKYAGLDGPSLVTVLDAMQRAVIDAFETDKRRAQRRTSQAFDSYRRGAVQLPEYAARFANVLTQSQQAGSQFTTDDVGDLAKTFLSVGALAAGHPLGLAGLTPDQLAKAAQAGGHLSAAVTRAVTGKKSEELSPGEYQLLTDPARELTRRTAAAMRTAASRLPIVVLLDTGEVLGDRAWTWLRRVMVHTGSMVLWVVGGRFEAEAEAGIDSQVAQFERDIGGTHLVEMSPTQFDNSMIREYLESRTSTNTYTETQIERIAAFTKGLPLAISFTATLLEQGQPVEDVCQGLHGGGPSSVVSQLARRYLIHAEHYALDDPRRDDMEKILGLALAMGDLRSDPDLLAALWNIPEPSVALQKFQDLASRHDFVLPVSRQLHRDVRDTLRTDLLDPLRRASVRVINQRASTLFNTRLAAMRTKWPDLDGQLDHTVFNTALLAALWHTVWLDNQDGLDLFAEILPIAAAADPSTAEAAAVMMDQFAGTFNDDQRRDLNLLTEVPTTPEDQMSGRRGAAPHPARRVRFTLAGLALCIPHSTEADHLVGQPGDRQVAVMILRAGVHAEDHNDEVAVTTLRDVAAQTSSARLRAVIGSQAQAIADRLIWTSPRNTATPTAVGLRAAKIATEMLTNNALAWNSYGAALIASGRNADALAAFDTAHTIDAGASFIIDNRAGALMALGRWDDARTAYNESVNLDRSNVNGQIGLGDALFRLNRFEEAMAAYSQALTLDPGNAGAQNGLGNSLQVLGRFEEAMATYRQALTLDPDNANANNGLGAALARLGRFEEALAAFDRALALDAGNAASHGNRGIALAAVGDFDHALEEFDTASRLAPTSAGEDMAWAGAILWHRREVGGARDRFAGVKRGLIGYTPFRSAEMEAVALCGLGEPDIAEQRLLVALPLQTPADRAEPRQIYELLTDPPLEGIDRLRRIVGYYPGKTDAATFPAARSRRPRRGSH